MSYFLDYLQVMTFFASMVVLGALWVASFIFAFAENKTWMSVFFFFFPPLGVFFAIYLILKEYAEKNHVSAGGILQWVRHRLNPQTAHSKKG